MKIDLFSDSVLLATVRTLPRKEFPLGRDRRACIALPFLNCLQVAVGQNKLVASAYRSFKSFRVEYETLVPLCNLQYMGNPTSLIQQARPPGGADLHAFS
jgi:hypothetical protein